MAKQQRIRLEIPAEKTGTVADAIAFVHGYEETVPDGTGGTKQNPQSKVEFANLMLRKVVRSWVESHHTAKQEDATRRKAAKQADNLGL